MYILDGECIEADIEEGQIILKMAHTKHLRPLCDCTTPRPEMYIAFAQGRYIVKRMPSSGADHSPNCGSFLPPEELSGLAQVQGMAIDEDPEDGTTLLRLDFPLSIRGKRAAPPPGSGEDATEANAPVKKLTLTSLLHYLWHDADLVKWVPGMKGKRWWGIVYNTLKVAATNKIAKQQNMSAKLFIPEPFKMDYKAEIAARRSAFFSNINQNGKGAIPLGILIAEYKSHETTRFGAKFTFKQMPDCPFFADEDLAKSFNKVFESNLILAEMVPDAHIIIIATFSLAKAGYPVLNEIGMMLTTKNWIPFEHMREIELIDRVTNANRRFAKSLRFNLSRKTPIASLILTDLTPPVACFVSGPSDNGESVADMINTAEEGTYPAWLWTDDEVMPELPR